MINQEIIIGMIARELPTTSPSSREHLLEYGVVLE
ncbi:unnamed protein product [Haemonchus placei]|uniref:Transcriptional regulator n=1 Tax=Haemonchus placei TaxID=6290 RepID=A0A0N4WIR8_HAEPC|nr:unnamed protein product [Haemonchus placei]